ncbi:MAG: S8 family serine peptidase [Clostridia bacterium]|nr:S8 family serine peptidase [Clostridia bacterium]
MKNINERSDKIGAFFVWLNKDSNSFYESNTAFLDGEGIPLHHRIYVSRYTPTVIVLLNEKDRERLTKTYEITPYLFTKLEKMSDEIILSDINADFVFDSTDVPKDSVKAGMIAVENLIYDDMAKSLEGLTEEGQIIVFPSIIPPKTDRHPTCVLSEIIGRKINADGVDFSGVARGTTVYFDALYSIKELFESIERMLDEGVRIINLSAGVFHDGIYSDLDRQIDRLTLNSDFLLVAAAGNYEKVSSPAKAYNALSVGNAVTKSSALSPLIPPYLMSKGSAYLTNNSMPHKPEISAPGEWVGFVDREGTGDFSNFGTSFATPLVTGAACQILNIKSNISYLTLKGLLLLSAMGEAISEEDNPNVTNSLMREKSGYGLLDAEKALALANECEIMEGRLEGDIEKEINAEEFLFIFELDEEKNYPRLFRDGEEITLYPQTSVLVKKSTRSVRIMGIGDRRFSLISL